jgi:anti-sigma factor RsiW
MDLEYSITQYLDGSLDESERNALESRLATDASARALLDEHRKLDLLLKAGGLPQLQWDAVAGQISAAVAALEIPAIQTPARSFKMPWVRMAAPFALAASVLIAAGLAIRFVHFSAHPPLAGMTSQNASSVAIVTGPQAEIADAASQSEIWVGPARLVAADSILPHYSDDVIARPARVTVASGINPPQDINPSPLDMQ